MDDHDFMSMVNLIASKHGCKIVDIDIDEKCIMLDGPTDEAQTACAIELEDVFGRYCV